MPGGDAIRSICLLGILAMALPGLCEDARISGPALLVSRPGLPDPNFTDTVVLVTEHGRPGVVGLIVNRPTSVTLASVFPDRERLRGREDKLYFGGPVARMQIAFIFRAAKRPEDTVELLEGVYLSGNREKLRELLDRDDPLEGLRVYAGHAGWAPGQLEAEASRGDWRIMRAEAAAIFNRKPESLWPELDRRASATIVLDATQ